MIHDIWHIACDGRFSNDNDIGVLVFPTDEYDLPCVVLKVRLLTPKMATVGHPCPALIEESGNNCCIIIQRQISIIENTVEHP